ncbi:MAG: hypothetical protein IH830_03510 [Planctomycetes bacterium]|nr:hypothetical protein [Planctomycetota bacterium]
MTRPHSPTRRGAALLLVLATLIVAITAAATLARLASTVKTQRIVATRTIVADDLLRAAEAPILAWLASKSSTVVLPPEATSPQVQVLHDAWVIDATDHELRITAWDQCGMVPINVARSGSPLRLALPTDVKRVLDQVTIPRDQPAGLDLFLAARHTGGAIGVFPKPTRSPPMVFKRASGEDSSPQVQSESTPPGISASEPSGVGLGAYLATHNPGRINVNTAAMDLVEAALRLAGRGGLEQIIAARTQGRLASLSALSPTADPHSAAPRIAASSNAWAFRIDLRVGTLRRSWWAVYVQSRSTWECVQRLAIPE